MGETLKSIYATWESYAKEHKVPKNPINWTEHHVLLWLQWTMDEFHFGGFTIEELVAEFKVSNNHFYKITIRHNHDLRKTGEKAKVKKGRITIRHENTLGKTGEKLK